MKKTLITIFLICLHLNEAFACLNGETKVLKNGLYVYADSEYNVPYGHFFGSPDSFQDGLKQLESLYKATKDLDYLSDKGFLLILLKRYNEAIKLYNEIEKIQPNRYSTASNLGTAYELFGQNEKALKWIKKSVKIDPKSHKNSEWIHVKILEAKIKGEKFYTTTFLLNTDFGSKVRPESRMTKIELQELSDALYYQLNERVSFVEPKEKLVAQLLFDFGNIKFLLGVYPHAMYGFEKAKEYGYRGQLIDQRIKEADKIYKKPKKSNKNRYMGAKSINQLSYLNYGIWLLCGILLTFFIRTILLKKEEK